MRFKFIVAALCVILVAASVFSGILYPDPWIIDYGKLELSIGWPTLAVRYGLLSFVEFGGSIRESGGYVKVGFNSSSFGTAGGYAVIPGEFSNIFASAGYRSGNFEIDLSGRYYQFVSWYEVENGWSMEFDIEALFKYETKKNYSNYFGAAFAYIREPEQEETPWETYSNLYFVTDYSNIWYFDILRLIGGLSFRYDGKPIDITKNFGIILGMSMYFQLLR